MEAAGIEPASRSQPESTQVPEETPGYSACTLQQPDRLAAQLAFLSQDSDLPEILEAWPNLTPPMRAGILAMIRAALGKCERS